MTGKGVDSAARQHRFKFLKSQSGLTAASVFSQAGSVASAAALRVVIRYTDMMHVLFTQKEDSSATLREKKKRLHVSVQCDGMEGIYNEPEAQTKHAHEHDLLSTGKMQIPDDRKRHREDDKVCHKIQGRHDIPDYELMC